MENLSLTPKRLVMGGIVVGLAVVVALYLRASEHPERTKGGQTVGRTTEPQGRKPGPTLSVPTKPRPGSIEPPMVMDDVVLESIIKKDKKLGLFMGYYKTVLPDKQRRDEYRKLLSDPAMMAAMAEELMDPGNGSPQPEEYYKRLMVVDYFEAALTWKDNPQRQKLLEVTRDIITKDNFRGDQDSARRQLLGGTKMEVYRLMNAQDPQKAGEMVAQAKGTRMESLVTWMAEEDVRRRVREKEILKEADELARRE